jgi:hypothetical protein
MYVCMYECMYVDGYVQEMREQPMFPELTEERPEMEQAQALSFEEIVSFVFLCVCLCVHVCMYVD